MKRALVLSILAAATFTGSSLLSVERADAGCCRSFTNWVRRAANTVVRHIQRAPVVRHIQRGVTSVVHRGAAVVRHVSNTARRVVHNVRNSTVGRAVIRVVTDPRRAIAEAANRARELAAALKRQAEQKLKDFGEGIARGVADAAKQTLSAIVSTAKKAWDAIKSAFSYLGDKIIEVSAMVSLKVLKPLFASLEDGLRDRAFASLPRREPVNACFTINGNTVQAAIAGVATGGIAAAMGAVTAALDRFAVDAAKGAAMGSGNVNEYTSLAAKQGAQEAIGQGAKEALAKSGLSMLVTAALHAATFPVGFFSSHFRCKTYRDQCRPDAYSDCYEKEYLEYSKNWLFSGFVKTALAALDPKIIIPLSLKVGAGVTTGVAAIIAGLTGGTGAVVAPAIGVIATLVTKIAIGYLLGELMKKLFFGTYERTTWAAAEGEFRAGIKRVKAARTFYGTPSRCSPSSEGPPKPAPQTQELRESFHLGKWLHFGVNVRAGQKVVIEVHKRGGHNAVLSAITLGKTSSTDLGASGLPSIVLPAWDGQRDYVQGGSTIKSVRLVKGQRYTWTNAGKDSRPPRMGSRRMACWYDGDKIVAEIEFQKAYYGDISLYAVDFDSHGRRQSVTVKVE